MTLNQITSAIRNRVADGLSGNISSQAFSILQLEDEVDLTRMSLLFDLSTQGIKLNKKFLYQTKDGLALECMDISQSGCGIAAGEEVRGVKIPAIISTIGDDAVEYFGTMDKRNNFITYFDLDSANNHKRRILTKNKPFIWVDTEVDENGHMTAYLLNMNKYDGLRYLSIRGIFSYPNTLKGSIEDFEDREYPAPGHLQNKIIDTLTEKYVRYFRQLNIPPQPNTQSDNVA